MKPKILAFAGSARQESYNKKLVRIAADAARAAGGDVTLIDLRDYPMPLYDGDLEAKEGMPSNAKKLKELMTAHQGFLISAPEYNSSMSGLLKNALDWASRSATKDEAPLLAFTAKTAALLSASPGALGGMRGLVHLRAMLENIKVLVIPDTFSLGKASDAFNTDGSLKDAKQLASVQAVAKKLVEVTTKLA
jgi:NAD(P)H-dependent FMN reductase